jgi:hypothetical protein
LIKILPSFKKIKQKLIISPINGTIKNSRTTENSQSQIPKKKMIIPYKISFHFITPRYRKIKINEIKVS